MIHLLREDDKNNYNDDINLNTFNKNIRGLNIDAEIIEERNYDVTVTEVGNDKDQIIWNIIIIKNII